MAQNQKPVKNVSVADNPTSEGGQYPIRTVSSLTGVNSITLRAWERRYGLIKPIRSIGGFSLSKICIRRCCWRFDKHIGTGIDFDNSMNSFPRLVVLIIGA